MHLRKLRLILVRFPSHPPILSIIRLCKNIHILVGMNHRHKLRSFNFNVGMRDFWIQFSQKKQTNINNTHRGQNWVSRKVPFERRKILIDEQVGRYIVFRLFLNLKFDELCNSLIHPNCFANSLLWRQGRVWLT